MTPPANGTCSSPPAGSTSYTYDALGHELSETDPLGNITRHRVLLQRSVVLVRPADDHRRWRLVCQQWDVSNRGAVGGDDVHLRCSRGRDFDHGSSGAGPGKDNDVCIRRRR